MCKKREELRDWKVSKAPRICVPMGECGDGRPGTKWISAFLDLIQFFQVPKKLFNNLVGHVRACAFVFRTLALFGSCPDHVAIR